MTSKAFLFVALIAAACVNKTSSEVTDRRPRAEAGTKDRTHVPAASPQVDRKTSPSTAATNTKKPLRQFKVATKAQQETTQQNDRVSTGVHKDGPG